MTLGESEEQARAIIRDELAQVLESDPVWLSDDTLFAESGIDSIVVITMVAALRRRTGVDLPEDVLFSADASIAAFARCYLSSSAGQPGLPP